MKLIESKCSPGRFAILFATLVLFVSGSALAAFPVYMSVNGQNQGPIEGDVMIAGREGTIEVLELHHLVHRPEGLPVHEPLILTKRVDRASVNLYRALDQGEFLTVLLDYYRIGGGGLEEIYYQVLLEEVRVLAIEPLTPNLAVPANADMPHMERIRLEYHAITVAHSGDGEVWTLFDEP